MNDNDKLDDVSIIPPGAFCRRVETRKSVVIAVLPPYLTFARIMARSSRKKKKLNWSELWDVPEKRGGFSICGPAVGAPNAVTLLENLIAFGAENFIVIGCCGSLREDTKIGDVILPTSAISEEGTSAHYSPEIHKPEASPDLVAVLERIALEKGWRAKKGAVWTTDAPYRETAAKVKKYGAQGVMAVEMELSAMFTVANYRGVKLAAALAVSDELASLKWKPGFLKPEFMVATTRVIRLALNTAASLK